MTEPEKTKPEVLDTKFMRAYKARAQRDNKTLIIVSVIVLLVLCAFAFWIVLRLDDSTSYKPTDAHAL